MPRMGRAIRCIGTRVTEYLVDDSIRQSIASDNDREVRMVAEPAGASEVENSDPGRNDRVVRINIAVVVAMVLVSCSGMRDTNAVSTDREFCLDCYFLGTYPLEAYFTTSLSRRDSSLYLAHSRDTDQIRVRRIITLLDQCEKLGRADPAKTHTYCVASRRGQEIGRIGIPPMNIDTPSTVRLYWQGYYCNCQWEVFPQLIQGFEPLYRDTIIDYIRGGTLRSRQE